MTTHSLSLTINDYSFAVTHYLPIAVVVPNVMSLLGSLGRDVIFSKFELAWIELVSKRKDSKMAVVRAE
jgi:hypothetical protein